MSFLDIFLFPFTLLEYLFSIMFWLFIISWIMMADWYADLSHEISWRYRELRDKNK